MSDLRPDSDIRSKEMAAATLSAMTAVNSHPEHARLHDARRLELIREGAAEILENPDLLKAAVEQYQATVDSLLKDITATPALSGAGKQK